MHRFILGSIFVICFSLFFGTMMISAQEKEGIMDAEMMDKKVMASAKVNINTADMEQLMNLPGVGEGTARKIIDYRKTNGNFKTLDQLKSVPGIGDKKYEKMKGMLTI